MSFQKKMTDISAHMETVNRNLNSQSILQNLIDFNSEEALQKNHQTYNPFLVQLNSKIQKEHNDYRLDSIKGIEQVFLKINSHQLGAELVGEWYKRNIKIYANILNYAEEEDRILVIFGQGHIPILKNLFEDNPDFEIVSPLRFLEK